MKGFRCSGGALSPVPFFATLHSLFCQDFQLFFNILAEPDLAFKDTAWPARNTVSFQLHAVISVEIKIFAGKCHGYFPLVICRADEICAAPVCREVWSKFTEKAQGFLRRRNRVATVFSLVLSQGRQKR